MAITRTHVTTLAAVCVDDDGAIELVVRANRTDATRVSITVGEARAFAAEIVIAADEADAYNSERVRP